MKKIISTIISVLIFLTSSAQDYYYYHNEKIYFDKNEHARNICLNPAMQSQQRKVLLDSLQMWASGVDIFSNYFYRFYVDSSSLVEFDAITRHHSPNIKLNAPELQYNNSIFGHLETSY